MNAKNELSSLNHNTEFAGVGVSNWKIKTASGSSAFFLKGLIGWKERKLEYKDGNLFPFQ